MPNYLRRRFFHASPKRLTCLSKLVLGAAGVLASTGVYAGQAQGVLDTDNGIQYTFVDSKKSATVNISGGARADRSTLPTLIQTSDSFWSLTVGTWISEWGDDEVHLTVALTHLATPHGDVDGAAETFSRSFSWDADDYPHGSINWKSGEVSKDHGEHKDVFKNFSFTGQTVLARWTDDEFTNWHFTMYAQHVPEPGTYAMLLSGLGVLGLLARRRSKQRGAVGTVDVA
nr:PEP-CTERM sorting domain-containing protein [uncultured Caldimonas sp.]